MITNERFTELYKQVSTIFDRKVEQVPFLEIKDDCPKIIKPEEIFDTLGYFRCDTPDRLYLCQKQIEEFAKQKNLDIQILAEIIAVHEIGHYIHSKLNTTCCTASDSDTFNTFRKYFVESFAQLLTHKFCINNSEKYCFVFNILKIGQSKEYTIYNDENGLLGGSLKQCPKSILENIFFDKNLEEEKEKIGNSNVDGYFFKLFEIYLIEYCEKISDTDEKFSKLMRLWELNLVNSVLFDIDSSLIFISEDTCSK